MNPDRPVEARPAGVPADSAPGHIGRSVVIRGELSGSEDLYLDAEIEGTIALRDHALVIGPNAKIKAHIEARAVRVHGRVEGDVAASERVELTQSGALIGNISTPRIVIEDGSFYRGRIDPPESTSSAPSRPAISSTGTASTPGIAPPSESSFSEPK